MKACSFYSTHWVAKVTCLLVCNGKPLLIKENNQRAYSYLELRCRKPSERTGNIPDPYFMTPNSMSPELQPSGKCPKKPLPHILVWPGSTSSPLTDFLFLHAILFRTPLEYHIKMESQVFILVMEQMGHPCPEGPSRVQSKAGSSRDKYRGHPSWGALPTYR